MRQCTGDCCTPEGCPIFWPAKKRFSVPIILHTGNAFETAFVVPLMLAACAYVLYLRFHL